MMCVLSHTLIKKVNCDMIILQKKKVKKMSNVAVMVINVRKMDTHRGNNGHPKI